MYSGFQLSVRTATDKARLTAVGVESTAKHNAKRDATSEAERKHYT